MRKTGVPVARGVLLFLILLMLASSVSALSKYYSPIVTGQSIINEPVSESFPGIFDNLILGTPAITNNRATFSTCVFSGSGDSDYRYMNVDEDGLIYLTDDDFINIFDDECTLITTHTINGTLMSQPFVFDSEGDSFQNIYYISAVGTISQLNEFELVNGVIISPTPNQVEIIDTGSIFCIGLYCDRDLSLGTCATFCNGASTTGDYKILDVNPVLSVVATVALDDSFSTHGFTAIYNEVTDTIREKVGIDLFDYNDRTFPVIYGMDIDNDNNIEVVTIHTSGNNIVFNQVDLTEQSMDTEGILITNGITGDADIYSSAGFGQVANFGSFSSNGEMFLSYMAGTLGSGVAIRWEARVFNSVGGLLKTVIDDLSSTYNTFKQSNFAVADIDVDFKNDYCIAFNNTRRNNETVIECYSGLTNNIMTNCTISGWATDNPIHLSLLNWDTTTIAAEAITTWGIFDLSEQNGGECTNLRPDGFIGLTSASEGALVPVAVGGDVVSGTKDSAVDLIYYGADGARLFKSQTITGEGSQSGILCGAAHIIFCDDFNYQFGLFQRGWQVLERDGEINTSITPIDNRLNSTDVKFQSFVHGTDSVDVNYSISTVGEERRIVLSFVHPVVSHSFELNIVDANGLIEFRIDDRDTQPSIQLRFRGANVSYVNDSAPTLETLIATEFLTPNVTHSIKVTQFFGLDNAKEQGEPYPFNISVDRGFYRVFIDNEMIADNIFFTNNASFDASTWIFTKNKNTITGFAMDNVFSYRGTSQAIDNSDQFFTPIVEDLVFECQVEGLFCAANAECCNGLTCHNNECISDASELITDTEDNAIRQAFRDIPTGGLGFDIIWYIVMFAVGITVFVGVAKVADGTSALGGTLIIEIFLLVIGTILGFVPVFIIITIVVIGLVIAALFLRKILTGSAS